MGAPSRIDGAELARSTVGYARSDDGIHFGARRQLIAPEHAWERFGCEDPRITRVDGRYYVFYPALSAFPFQADGIRVGVAVSDDLEHFEKHPVTPFNAKAMALFPERIDGRLVAVLTANTDRPPAKVAIAVFERDSDLWSEDYWQAWYRDLDRHVVPLLRSPADQVEVGAAPLATAQGWLLVYAYIRDYFHPTRRFGVEAVLLDRGDPRRVRSRSAVLLLAPERDYERRGAVPDVAFPSGAVVDSGVLRVYYGAADTCACAAQAPIDAVLDALMPPDVECFVPSSLSPHGFARFSGNPVLRPRPELAWEARAAFNPAALHLGGRVHLLYRAMAVDGTSRFGHASSADGVHFDERSCEPVYGPRVPFEARRGPGNCGCEDPRLTVLEDTVHLFYTAYDGHTPRVACSRLGVADFLARRWHWSAPTVVTPPGVDDKDGALLSRRIGGRYVVFHRFGECMRVSATPTLDFGDGRWLGPDAAAIRPRKEYWDNGKFGIAAPPLETSRGWVVFFHRVTRPHAVYKVEALLLALDDPTRVIAETGATLLEPETDEERFGQTPNVVFPCGAVLVDGTIYLYYGGADSVVCVASMPLLALFRRMGL